MKSGYMEENEDHREAVAGDDGMQAAIGAAHVEAHEDAANTDFLSITKPSIGAHDMALVSDMDNSYVLDVAADRIRQVVNNPGYGKTAAFLVITLAKDAEGRNALSFAGNMDTNTVISAAFQYAETYGR